MYRGYLMRILRAFLPAIIVCFKFGTTGKLCTKNSSEVMALQSTYGFRIAGEVLEEEETSKVQSRGVIRAGRAVTRSCFNLSCRDCQNAIQAIDGECATPWAQCLSVPDVVRFSSQVCSCHAFFSQMKRMKLRHPPQKSLQLYSSDKLLLGMVGI